MPLILHTLMPRRKVHSTKCIMEIALVKVDHFGSLLTIYGLNVSKVYQFGSLLTINEGREIFSCTAES